MELYNDLIFSGKGLYNIINDDNIYTNKGIIFKSINSNQDLSINADSNYLNFSIKPISIDINYNKPLSINNILHISSNSNIGVGLINPQNPLDVAGTISCIDININDSILNKDIIKNIGFSATNINNGILKIMNGGTNTSNINQDQLLLFGKFQQSPFLIWKNNERKIGICSENPQETLDISGDTNALYYRINGNDINNIFVKDLYTSSNDCFTNCSNITFLTSANYTNDISYNLINIINSRTIDWVKSTNGNNYIQSKVGIGTSIPSSSLNIIGDINYTGELRIKGYLNKVFDGNYAHLNNSPGYTWDISNANLYNLNKGSVGIGTEIPKYKLDVNGSINYRSDIRKNGNIINIFDGNYKNLIDTPTLSKFAYSGSFYDLTELPYIFNGEYSSLNNIPSFFPTNWDSKYILNMPIYFNTNWDTHVMNKPEYFTTNWNKYVKNKPKFFDVDYNINIKNKPLYLPVDWNKTIVNKPINYNVDWDSNIYNKPDFSEFAYTGDFKNLLNKPFIFSGLYRELLEKPNFSLVSFTGNYNDLLNRPNLFSGDYNELLNIPSYFLSDWNLNITNKPDFPTIAFSGLFKDISSISSINNWGENGIHIYSCNISNIGIGITNPSFKLDIKGGVNFNDGLIINNINNFKNNNPWGVYFAEDFDGSLLRDSSGNDRHATTSTGNIIKTSGSGNGALGNINYLTGGTSSIINWPSGSIPVNFTILSLTRYTGGSRKRILTSDRNGGNFLHGHWGYDLDTNKYRGRGCVHYDRWKSRYSSPILGNLDDWLCCIGKNGGTISNNILFDGVPSGTENGGVGGYKLCINDYGENSDWAFGCVIIWDYHLTDEDCFYYNSLIQNYLNTGGSIKKFFKDNNIYLNNTCYFNNSNNFKFLTSNEFYITSNWIVDSNSNSNIYNLNKGSVGINNINPSSSYKLDVNGLINTNSYLNLLKNNISWSSYNSYINLNTLSVVSINEITNSKFLNPIINITGRNNTINIANDNPAYKYVFFANSGTFQTDIDIICDILVVGGGGSGAGHIGGGGGGGSVVYIRNATILSGTYNVVVGNGGSETRGANKGQNSSFAGIIAEGGGKGGQRQGSHTSGGSGGGANPFLKNFDYTINLGGSVGSESTLNNFFGIIYGNKGGDGLKPLKNDANSGGGGGAGEAGGNANSDSTQSGGKGGDGILINITGTAYYWGAGGGGSSQSKDDGVTSRAGNGGLGGGGGGSSASIYHGSGGINGINNGTTPTNHIGGSGGQNTGSGGGGGSFPGNNYGVGGAGGSGVVIIRYAINQIYNQLNNFNIKSDLNKKLILSNGSNNEVLFVNSGNIGIGISNPSSIIHLHNISSNKEVKLSLSTSLSISKNTNNEGVIWNTNKGLCFGTNNTERLSLNNIEKIEPWGIYFAGNFSNNTLYDISGNGRHAITSDNITKTTGSGNGANSSITYISGATTTTISWPTGSIPEKFTILSLTRYTGGNRRRILQSSDGNWIHGHWNGLRGVCYYNGWKTAQTSRGTQDNWLCCIGKNSSTTSNNILVDGEGIGINLVGDGNKTLVIKNTGEISDWALSYVVIWNRHLTDEEMFYNNSLINNYLSLGTQPTFVLANRGSKIEINNNSINLHNTLLNQEVKINLTDYSQSSLGFSLYKSSNNDGFLFNNKNNHLIFGTNNNEKLRITNLGNIGIGTSNPSSIIHLHDISSNKEVKLLLSTSLSISKNINNEGVIWNTNKGITFGTNNTERLSLNNIEKIEPWGIYFAGNFSNNTLYDISGNGRHAITSDNITKTTGSGNGANSSITYISGDTTTTISWPTGSIPNNFTILSLTRYTNTNDNTNRGRILQGQIRNFLHGHHNNKRGLCHYDRWKTREQSIGNINDWLCCIGKNGGTTPKNIIVDGSNIGNEIGGYGNDDLRINLGAHSGETSDWALSYVVIWNRHLTDNEMISNSSLITNYLSSGTEPSFISANGGSKIEINNNSINLHNTSLNQEVKINLTDYSQSSLGFSLYKSTNNDGFLFNNKNNHLIFGTINNEKLRITNLGNIGIGTSNPSSIIHLHNISSNQEVKLSLSTSLFISKNTNNDGVIWNTNKGITFGTNNTERLSLNNIEKIEPWGIYFAGNFSNNTLYDISGNGRHAITSDNITKTTGSGNGANSSITYIYGATTTTISWPTGSIPEKFTILSLTRYTGDNRRKILQSSDGNWIHGHYEGIRGVCYYNGWKTAPTSRGTQDNWLCCIGKNSSTTSNNILVDGEGIGINLVGDGNKTLVIKNTGDWALSYVVIWNRHLTDEEMFYNNSLITNYLSSGTQPTFVLANRGSKIEINNNSINLHNTSLNQEVKINLTDNSQINGVLFYKGTTNDGYIWNNTNPLIFGTNNIERLRITYSGNIGISSTIPTNTLDVNGTINGQYLKGDGSLITNLDFTKFTTGKLYVINGGTGLSNISNNLLLIGDGTSPISQNSNLIWINDKIGIKNSNPQHKLDVNGTIKANFLRGDGTNISNLDITKFTSGILSISNGGIGTSTLTANQILIGNGTTDIKQTNNLFWNSSTSKLGICFSSPSYHIDIVGNLKAINLFGNGSNITNLNVSNFANIISLNKGGTAKSIFESNQILIGGDSTTPIKQSINLIWNNSSNRLGIGYTNPSYNVDINGSLKGTLITGNGSNISNLNSLNFASGICSVNAGGTGKSIFVSNQILIGNGTDAITQTPNIIWNNTSNRLGIFVANPNYTLDISGNINFTGNLTNNGEIYQGIGKLVNWNLSSGTSNIYYNTGSVGIGTNSINPAYKLNVNGKIKCLLFDLTSESSSFFNLVPQIIKINTIESRRSPIIPKILFNLDTKIEGINNFDSNVLKFETKILSDISSNGFYFKNDNVGIYTNSSKYPLCVYNTNIDLDTYNQYDGEIYNLYYNLNNYLVNIYSDDIFNISGVNNYLKNKSDDINYKYAYFANNGSFYVNEDITCEILIVGGGGSGAKVYIKEELYPGFLLGAGGGGAGGVGIGTVNFKKGITYQVTIGSGGASTISANINGNNGENTSITGGDIDIIAYGGGGGGGSFDYSQINYANNGGSGGGARHPYDRSGNATKGSSSGGNASIVFYGNNGVPDRTYSNPYWFFSDNWNGCGGGGAGTQINRKYGHFARGENGLQSSITGVSTYYGGGGGGSYGDYYDITWGLIYDNDYGPGTLLSSGGFGGGGNGEVATSTKSVIAPTSGTNNTGGGGGGSTVSWSGAGGSGVVIIKYRIIKTPTIEYKAKTNVSNVSAEFRNTIQVKGDIVSSSDNRIKKDVVDINSKNALDLISKINPKSFNYIDNIEKGIKNNYGFVAQDIIKIIPDAVRFTKDIIPNIMKKYRIKNDIIETNEDLTSKLLINDNIEIIDKDNNKNKYKIIEISSNYIKIDKSIEDNYGFIYGKEVEDLHILDKKIIFTLNVSATQELNKQIKKQQKKLLKQQMKLIKQEKIIKEQELKFEEQEKQLKYLFINYY